jgi:hypothetical protein
LKLAAWSRDLTAALYSSVASLSLAAGISHGGVHTYSTSSHIATVLMGAAVSLVPRFPSSAGALRARSWALYRAAELPFDADRPGSLPLRPVDSSHRPVG